MESSQEKRRRRGLDRRKTTVLHKGKVGEVETDLHPLRGARALSIVHQLTTESWSLARLPWPSYQRSEIPCVFVPDARG